MKRGQITLFVILGIVIIGLLAAAYYLRSSFVKTTAEKTVFEESELTTQEIEVKNIVEDCLSEIGEEAILYTSARGGYYEPPGKIEPFNSVAVPYYLYKDKEEVPTIETLQEQIALYIDNNIKDCVIENSPEVEIVQDPTTTAILNDEKLRLETEMPVSIGTVSERRITSYSAEIKTKYKQVYNDAIEVYNKLKIIDNFLFVDLSELALNKDYELRTAIEDEKIVALLLYKNFKIKETPVRFNFAILHDSAQRVTPDDIFSKNTVVDIVKGLQQLFASKEITTDEEYETEEMKYEGVILQSAQNPPIGSIMSITPQQAGGA